MVISRDIPEPRKNAAIRQIVRASCAMAFSTLPGERIIKHTNFSHTRNAAVVQHARMKQMITAPFIPPHCLRHTTRHMPNTLAMLNRIDANKIK